MEQNSRIDGHTMAQLERGVDARRSAYIPADLAEVFTYHTPTAEQQKCYVEIRQAARAFAVVVLENTPPCNDQTEAIDLIRSAVMRANAAVALKGLV